MRTLITYPQYRFPKVLKALDTYSWSDFGLLVTLLSTVLMITNLKISAELINTNKRQRAFCPRLLRLTKSLVTSQWVYMQFKTEGSSVTS